eukprot:TRINITY_DN14120_c0_g1_i1.p1 TRINITY_DN14120_c0_g1~~TRINITY_DN14120_c0_g1_i1.p1  ORF type:complete len:146 (-),score=28.22 TRINITY_DN14120_c0_g1_i1:82-459(-)
MCIRDSPYTFQKFSWMYLERNMYLLDITAMTTVNHLSRYSLALAGALKFTSHTEKVRLFETTSIPERLIIVKERIEYLHNHQVDPTLIFELEAPLQNIMGYITSLLMIVAIIVLLFCFRRFNLRV